MKKLFLLAVCAFGVTTAAQAQTVDVGTGDWERLPKVREVGQNWLGAAVADAVLDLGRRGTCEVPGLGRTRVDLSIPFVMEFDSRQSIQRIVLKDVNCPELETLLGRVVQKLASTGEYVPTGGPGWYRSALELAID